MELSDTMPKYFTRKFPFRFASPSSCHVTTSIYILAETYDFIYALICIHQHI